MFICAFALIEDYKISTVVASKKDNGDKYMFLLLNYYWIHSKKVYTWISLIQYSTCSVLCYMMVATDCLHKTNEQISIFLPNSFSK